MTLTNIRQRLTRIEAGLDASEKANGGWQPYDNEAREAEVMEQLAALGISTTPAEAEAKGYSCIMEEAAAALGYVGKEAFQQFRWELEQKSDDWYSRHEFRWVGERFPKQCQIRERMLS